MKASRQFLPLLIAVVLLVMFFAFFVPGGRFLTMSNLLDLTPMIDMVFNLLIFFMAATTFTQIEKDLTVQLPKAWGFQTLSAVPKQIIINIRQDGATYVDGRQRTDAELSEVLSSAVKADPGREVLIRVDERSIMQPHCRM